MATFWQGNWARSPQQQSGLQQISQSVPPPEKTKPSHSKKEDQDTEAQEKAQERNRKQSPGHEIFM